MSATTSVTTEVRPVQRTTDTAANVWRIVRFIAYSLRAMLLGYWLIMVVGFTLVGVGIHLATGTLDESVWDYASQSPKYFSSAIGIMLMPTFFALLVAHGVTRRTIAQAGTAVLLLSATATTCLWIVMYQLESAVYAWQDWPQKFMNPHVFTSNSQVGLIFLEFFLLIMSHQVSGWIIATGFFRFGFWTGLLVLPVGLIPAVVTEFLLIAGWVGQVLGWDRAPLAVSVPVVLAIVAAGLYGNYLMMRPIGLKQVK
ncbi:hypothetical protein OG394_33325 [Kribbella sp. NBC_01245]|uniref:hypothetical protein n=1 Tax=Kribbella sp. NBC_01245 TaxID=2903578 RepID=UPI002E299066|nr:hypothetical protein [Kribbella sp. NBC_01245]